MQQRRIILCLVLVYMSLMTASAQDTPQTVPVWSHIDSVTASWTDVEGNDGTSTSAIDLAITGTNSDGCEADLVIEQATYPNNVDVQLYRELSISQTCVAEETPFQADVDVPISEMPPYLIINDQVWQVTMPENIDTTSDVVPTLEEQMLVSSTIDTASVTPIPDDDTQDELAMTGGHGVGCKVPSVYSIRKMPDRTVIGVFDPVPPSGSFD